MLHRLSRKAVLIGSLLFVSMMFTIVMFVVNPMIDGENGFGVIALQLSFHKEAGVEIIQNWGTSGISNFKKWIFTDYLYALSYALFLASLLSWLIVKKGKEKNPSYTRVVYLPFCAGLLDGIENTMELFFINNPADFSSLVFFLHSIIASLKWGAVPVAFFYIVLLLSKNDKDDVTL